MIILTEVQKNIYLLINQMKVCLQGLTTKKKGYHKMKLSNAYLLKLIKNSKVQQNQNVSWPNFVFTCISSLKTILASIMLGYNFSQIATIFSRIQLFNNKNIFSAKEMEKNKKIVEKGRKNTNKYNSDKQGQFNRKGFTFSQQQSDFEKSSFSQSQNRRDPQFRIHEKKKYKSSQWTVPQLRKIFDSYQQHGSQWSQISKHLPNRSQNDIKNKFYGVTKNVLRGIFKIFSNLPGKQLKAITSRKICLLYQGRNQFNQFKGFIRKALDSMQFTVSRNKFKFFVELQKMKIQKLHNILFLKKIDLVLQQRKQESQRPPTQPAQNQIQLALNGVNSGQAQHFISQEQNFSDHQQNVPIQHIQQTGFPLPNYWVPAYSYPYHPQHPFFVYHMPHFGFQK